MTEEEKQELQLLRQEKHQRTQTQKAEAQLAQAGISLQDLGNGLLLLLCQEAEIQEPVGLGLWLTCHEEARQGLELLWSWMAPLGHQPGHCPGWAHAAP